MRWSARAGIQGSLIFFLLASVCLPASSVWATEGPVEVSYLEQFTEAEIELMIMAYGLRQWDSPDYDLFDHYEKFRVDLAGRLEKKVNLSAGRALKVPFPEFNRMALTLLRRRGKLFNSLGGELAFMTKYAKDGELVRWVELGNEKESLQFNEAKSKDPPPRGKRYALNCYLFVQYAAYLAGLPADDTATDSYQITDPPGVPGNVNSSVIGMRPWRGWWTPYHSGKEALQDKQVGLQAGDLIGVYALIREKEEMLGSKKETDWEFMHVEVVVRPDPGGDWDKTRTIGNSGEMPHDRPMGETRRGFGAKFLAATSFFVKRDYLDWRYYAFRFASSHQLPSEQLVIP